MKGSDDTGFCPVSLAVDGNGDPGFQLMDGGGSDGAVYLDPIFPVVCELWVQQPVVERGVVGQEEEAFAIEIQSADRIAIGRHGEEIL